MICLLSFDYQLVCNKIYSSTLSYRLTQLLNSIIDASNSRGFDDNSIKTRIFTNKRNKDDYLNRIRIDKINRKSINNLLS